MTRYNLYWTVTNDDGHTFDGFGGIDAGSFDSACAMLKKALLDQYPGTFVYVTRA